MNRRTALRQLFILAGGVWMATSCDPRPNSPSIELRNIDLTRSDEEFLGQLVDAIIPTTDSPGGRELNLHLFVMKMLDDCASPEQQQQFLEGLALAEQVKDKGEDKQRAYLNDLPKEDTFYSFLKRRALQGYKNSAYVMKNKLIYELVPGRYNGAVKISV
ncbi:MAG TPA: gluconate 2-dehydrogenase subunit 3 family protein [Candidatus Sphingobacterium stercorigallinarum]|nr:gluconate 2-dehydrogenase subunit 3 family protein [Candidatus Sphingobacterium stercorigallinarum]